MFWTMTSEYYIDDFTHCLLPGKSIDSINLVPLTYVCSF